MKPFVTQEAGVWTSQEEIEKVLRRIQRADELGIDISRIDDSKEFENPYEVEALMYILMDKPVPEELKKKVKG